VEKYLKAFLAALGIDLPRTHDIQTLVDLVPKDARPSLTVEQQRRLTVYATVLRYPGPYEPVALTEARQAVTLARRVRREIRKSLQDKPLF
jgi:HEPN domain-containing protein